MCDTVTGPCYRIAWRKRFVSVKNNVSGTKLLWLMLVYVLRVPRRHWFSAWCMTLGFYKGRWFFNAQILCNTTHALGCAIMKKN